MLQVPTVNDVPVEEHMRAGVRDLLRRSGYTRKSLTRDSNGVLRVPYKGPKYRLSLQASVRYDVLEEARKQEQLRHKYSRLGPDRFVAGGRIKPAPYTRGIHGGDEFLESWKNPYNARGIPPSQQTLRERDLTFTKVGVPRLSRRQQLQLPDNVVCFGFCCGLKHRHQTRHL